MRRPRPLVLPALAVLASVSLAPSPAAERLRVVTSTADLAAIAREVGGDRVEVESIAPGTQDPHFVELRPSYMIRVRKAAVYVKVGMDLDYWAQAIIDGSRNAKLEIVDCSARLSAERRLEVPTRVDASMGDVHRYGNPHYWLDPANGGVIAEAIAEGLARVDPEGRAVYDAGLSAFNARLEAKLVEWRRTAEALRGLRIVTYHNSWPYFTRAFGIEVVDWLEPKPGVKPSPNHVSKLIERIKAQGVACVAYEPYFEKRTPELVSRETGVPVVVLLPSVGGVPEVTDYFELFDYNLSVLARYARP
jgi:ABC-type Zn uptake system ZnuABC Zn-binding protein ZnuA